MSVNLKIGFNNNLNIYKKFLGVTMDNTLSWNDHIDLLMKKLSSACHIIRNDLSCFLSLGYVLWNHILGKFVTLFHNFQHKKKASRITEGCGNIVSCRNLFKKLQILPLTPQYISLLMSVVQNKNLFLTLWRRNYFF